jgi:chemotaxis protein methyltransferase CheR
VTLSHPEIAPFVAVACDRLRAWIGLDLERGGVKRAIERHVAARLAALERPALAVFAALLDSPSSEEAQRLVEAATVPHSWLWRDGPQLAALAGLLGRAEERTLDAWVPGCASGEDAYTIAALALSLGHSISVLATDVHRAALGRARRGRYGAWACRELPAAMRRFLPDDGEGGAVASDSLRARVTFERHSLIEPPPAPASGRGWDLVVCRNVLIYFAAGDTHGIVERLAGTLAPDGLLVLGGSDVLADLPKMLVPAGPAGRAVLARAEAVPVRREPTRPIGIQVAARRPRSRPSPPRAPRRSVPAPAAAPGGDVDTVLASARARIAADASDADAQLVAGLALHAKAAYGDSIPCLRAAACLAPGAWAAWLYMGLGFERLGHWDDAHRAFRQVARAHGPGGDLPRGAGELALSIHGARRELVSLAERRAAQLGRQPRRQR